MSKIQIYHKPGGTDWERVKEKDATEVNTPVHSGAIKVPVTGYEEGDDIELALKVDAGYETVEDTSRHARVTIENSTHKDKWALGLTTAAYNAFSGTPDPLDFNTKLEGDTYYSFYVKARVHQDEEPANDSSVWLKVEATIGAE